MTLGPGASANGPVQLFSKTTAVFLLPSFQFQFSRQKGFLLLLLARTGTSAGAIGTKTFPFVAVDVSLFGCISSDGSE